MAEKYVVVPQSHLDNLRQARDLLYELYTDENTPVAELVKIQQVSMPMYILSHQQYPETHIPK